MTSPILEYNFWKFKRDTSFFLVLSDLTIDFQTFGIYI